MLCNTAESHTKPFVKSCCNLSPLIPRVLHPPPGRVCQRAISPGEAQRGHLEGHGQDQRGGWLRRVTHHASLLFSFRIIKSNISKTEYSCCFIKRISSLILFLWALITVTKSIILQYESFPGEGQKYVVGSLVYHVV